MNEENKRIAVLRDRLLAGFVDIGGIVGPSLKTLSSHKRTDTIYYIHIHYSLIQGLLKLPITLFVICCKHLLSYLYVITLCSYFRICFFLFFPSVLYCSCT
jgi:hypothetical protein